jgi:hypothetical protein
MPTVSRKQLEAMPGFDPAFHLGETGPVPEPPPAPECDEKHFMADVIKLAKQNGWLVYHTHNSRKSQAGFPDLCMVRFQRLLFVELKTETGKMTAAQHDWFDAINKVPGTACYLWRPSDWPAILEILK